MRDSRSPVIRERFPFLVAATGFAVAISLLKIAWLSVVAGAVALFVFWFFRDPERSVPTDEHQILSPADGRVVGIVEVREDRFLKDRAIRVSVFLSLLNVHVNRIPYSGWIREMVYQPGQFRLAQQEEASVKNEQNAILLESASGKKIVFVQIAGFLARRILCWVRVGDHVTQGARFGMIRFGSRMDLYLPPTTRLKVKIGDRVKGGLTVIGELP